MTTALITHIRRYINISDEDLKVIQEYFTPISLKNKEFVLQDGQICKSYYFVEKGCLRMFFINDKGTEQITQFALENWWLADYFSLSDQKPSRYYIQSVGKSEVLSISHQSFEKLLSELPSLERYFRIIMQRAVAASQQRIKLLYSLSKEELYLHFNSYFPEFSQRVPQYMLASFLGLTPEYVSEIRKKKG
ncbi:Crp/Fnr family transcriptional regulator [Dysgonomonas sp. OttesenSCG-928-M03]|nr:Crp/Fnr family transcriptional regulator [Dysgonomonas sp. OttesenSCG-928-M03]